MKIDSSMLKILFVTEALGNEFFGVSKVLLQLMYYLSKCGVEYRVLSTKTSNLTQQQKERVALLPMHSFAQRPTLLGRMFRWHPKIKPQILEEIERFKPDIVHVHGVMTPVQIVAINTAIRKALPVILSPHGMLEPSIWKQKGRLHYWLKRLYWNVFFRPIIKKVKCLHSITTIERENLSLEFPDVAQILISNGADEADLEMGKHKSANPEKTFVFLGRLHPIKGLDILIKAFSRANLPDDWRLLIVGPDFDLAYSAKIRQLTSALKLDDRVKFLGPIYDNDKYTLLAKAWAVVVPSYSEVTALVNFEAAVVSTPSITTRATGLHDWEESGGLLVDPEVKQLTRALSTAASWSLVERLERGENARQFVKDRYSWDVIGKQWLDAYRTVASKGRIHE